MTDGRTEWRQTGNTDFASFSKAIARRFDGLGPSPMAAEAEPVYAAVARHDLSRLAAAMSWHERKNDSWKADYGLDSSFRNPWAMKAPGGGWKKYASYAEAAADWAERLLSPKGPYARTSTLADLIAVYAPNWDPGNDEARYVATIAREIDALPRKDTAVANPFPRPVIHDIDTDWALYGISQRQAKKVAANRFWDRNGQDPKIVVLHIQEGNTPGSLRYWSDTPGVSASSTVMIQKNGSILKIVDPEDGPWTNGDVQSPSEKGSAFLASVGQLNPNLFSLSVEAEGFWSETPPAAQVDAICWQVWEWLVAYGLTPADVYRHADFNGRTRANCPGVYFDLVMQKVRAAWLSGGGKEPTVPTFTGLPQDVTDALVKALFPEASPTGPVTRVWLDYCNQTGRWPEHVNTLIGTDVGARWQKAFVFSDGLLIYWDGSRAYHSVQPAFSSKYGSPGREEDGV